MLGKEDRLPLAHFFTQHRKQTNRGWRWDEVANAVIARIDFILNEFVLDEFMNELMDGGW